MAANEHFKAIEKDKQLIPVIEIIESSDEDTNSRSEIGTKDGALEVANGEGVKQNQDQPSCDKTSVNSPIDLFNQVLFFS